MDHLDRLEAQSVYILREAYRSFPNLAMLWSIGKDSTVLLWLTRKAFFGHVPYPLVHIDTAFKVPEMIRYRDEIAVQWDLNLVVGQNKEALAKGETFVNGLDRLSCCKKLKSDALKYTLDGTWARRKWNPYKKEWEAAPKSAYFPPVMKRASGMPARNLQSFGTNTKQTLLQTRTCAFTRF